MKKILAIALIAILITTTACDNSKKIMENSTESSTENMPNTSAESKTDGQAESVTTASQDKTLPVEGVIDTGLFNAFCVDKNDNIYTLNAVYENKEFTLTVIDGTGKKDVYNMSFEDLSVVNARCMCFKDNKIYYISEELTTSSTKNSLCVIDLTEENKKSVVLYASDDYSEITKIDFLKDILYIFGSKKDLADKKYELCPMVQNIPNNFTYSGEVISEFDIINKTIVDIQIELPIAFSVTKNNSIMIYAYDSIRGYHFEEYKDGRFFEKVYNATFIGMSDFEMITKDNSFILTKNANSLLSATAAEESTTTEMLQSTVISDKLRCTSGYIYYVDNSVNIESQRLNRLKAEGLIKEKPTIKLISSQPYMGEIFSCGYPMNKQQLAEDGFALNIMSQSSDFDLCFVCSEQTFSDSMKTKGVFEPLNALPSVVEYIDKCFPAIKEAATNDKGEIWMFPIQLDIPAIVYSKLNCEKQGLNFTSTMSVTDFIDIVEKVHADGSLTNYYDANAYRYSESMISQYLAVESTFETPLFRTLLPILRDRVSGTTSKFTNNIMLGSVLKTSSNHSDIAKQMLDNFLFIQLYRSDEQRHVDLTNATYRAVPLPKLTENSKSSALCWYICVNPYSSNKEATMQYISELAKYMMKQKDALLLSNPEMYTKSAYATDLLNIYNDAKINFALPSNIFAENYSQYVYGLMDEDEFIAEADRKWDAYRNE